MAGVGNPGVGMELSHTAKQARLLETAISLEKSPPVGGPPTVKAEGSGLNVFKFVGAEEKCESNT